MKYALVVLAAIAAAPSLADDMSHAEYFERERTGNWTRPVSEEPERKPMRVANTKRDSVKKIVAEEARRQLGEKWVNTAVRIAYVESRFNPDAVGPQTRHGRAQGVMQVMPGTARAMGFDPKRLREPLYGTQAGIAHMKLCISSGVQDEQQMAACHVSGVQGWKRRLVGRHESYKRRYVVMVRRAEYR